MPKLRIGFSDDSELVLDLEFDNEQQQNEYIDERIREHMLERTIDVVETSRMWTSDLLSKKDQEEGADEGVTYDPNQEALDFRIEDTEYVTNKLFQATRIVHTGSVVDTKTNEVVILQSTKEGTDLTDLNSLKRYLEKKVKKLEEKDTDTKYSINYVRTVVGDLRNMNAEQFVEFANRMDIERSLLELKYGDFDYGVAFDFKIEDLDEEKIVNIMGNLPRPLFAAYNEKSQRYECMVIMRDALVAIVSGTKAGALLRGLITLRSGKLHNNHDLMSTLLVYWQEAHNTKENPLIPSNNVLEELIKEAGTSVEEIDAEYKAMVEKAKANP